MKHPTRILTALILIGVLSGQGCVGQQPVSQNQPETNDRGSEQEDVQERDSMSVETENVAYYGDTEGYLARPAEGEDLPAVILIHEWWGLNDNIRSLAQDFANEGYVALAVDLYGGEVADRQEMARELSSEVRSNPDEATNNLQSAVNYLKARPYTDSNRIASVGWCFGGGWAYEMAKNNIGVDATVMYYGQFNVEDDLQNMRADILGHFGEEDRVISIDNVNAFEAKLNTLNGDHEVFIYPNVGHAFANESNPESYDPEAAETAWGRTLEFLSRELKE